MQGSYIVSKVLGHHTL